MSGSTLVLNAGSSSIKFVVFAVRQGELAPVVRGQIEGLYTAPRFVAHDGEGRLLDQNTWKKGIELGHDGAIAFLTERLRAQGARIELAAVGHRVVHGGTRHSAPVRVDAGVLATLEKLVPLAPLHQPHNLAPIRALLAARPDLPQVACFDTAFHRTQPALAQAFALPRRSPRAACAAMASMGFRTPTSPRCCRATTPAPPPVALVVLHLGNGASMCAMKAARASRAPWASPPWRDFRWARAAAPSTRA